MATVTVSVLLLIILALAPAYNARPQNNINISQSGNTKITTINGVIKCDEMVCPDKSIGCSVSTESINNLADIETVRKCYDLNRVTLKEQKSTAPNPYPGTSVSSYSDSSNTGVMQFHYGNGEPANQDISSKIDSMNKQFLEWQQNFQQEMAAFNTNFERQMQNNLGHSIPK